MDLFHSVINPWLASPFIFALGIALLYTPWLVARLAAPCLILAALLLAATPGDSDNWWMAVVEITGGTLLLVLVRPRWMHNWQGIAQAITIRFSLRQLLVAISVLGLCCSLLLLVVAYRGQRTDVVTLVHPLLESYGCTVGIQDGLLRLISTQDHEAFPGPVTEQAGGARSLRFYTSLEKMQPLGDADLASIVSRHPRLRFLNLTNSEVTPAGLGVLGQLAELQVLALHGSQLAGDGVQHLEQLSALSTLIIQAANPSDVENIREALSDCRVRLIE